MQTPHVASKTRNSQEAGTVIDQFFEHGRIELLLACQIDQNAGIEITAACAHDHSASRGQSHAGIDRFTAFDRGDARAIAEMGDDQAIRQIMCKLVQDRFARKAVKPVALDALRSQFLGDRKNARHVRLFGVKRGVETRHLRKVGKMLPREADDRQSRRNMQRREGGGSLKVSQDRIIDEAVLP